MTNDTVSFETVLRSTRRLPFDNADGQILLAYFATARKNSLDISIDAQSEVDVKQMPVEGVILLRSLSLDSSFLFVKINGGRGFLGTQKANLLSYLGDFWGKAFRAGPSFRTLPMAITSVNNIYRGVGALKGPAF